MAPLPRADLRVWLEWEAMVWGSARQVAPTRRLNTQRNFIWIGQGLKIYLELVLRYLVLLHQKLNL